VSKISRKRAESHHGGCLRGWDGRKYGEGEPADCADPVANNELKANRLGNKPASEIMSAHPMYNGTTYFPVFLTVTPSQ
jgi:hypothetical protein